MSTIRDTKGEEDYKKRNIKGQLAKGSNTHCEMTTRPNPLLVPFALVAVALIAPFASAQDSFDIEVYGSETLQQGETAVELHSNFNAEAEDNPTPGVYPTHFSNVSFIGRKE